ncbi:MAG TPA: YjhG/YagF family D-xylonate dehydratase [Vicinamibacteria bacterium]|nr:YjhG/YagF family D-xylonate dehydratase [Vicinamibacteria bacterium]
MKADGPSLDSVLDSQDDTLYRVTSSQPGPPGSLPLTPTDLVDRPSGDVFGWSQNVGMGWTPADLRRPEVLVLSTLGGMRNPDGTPLALGYHTGHWEVGLLVQAAAEEIRALGGIPFAAFCTDPCDGRTQGTSGMLDSLAYRNDAAIVLRRLIRSLPTRKAVMGVATCDKGLPAMTMALAACRDLPAVIVPGGVTLPASDGEDAGKAQTIGARFAHGRITLEQAGDIGCRACASPGGGCQFLGTAATAQVIAEALGLALPHTALAPSGQPIWRDGARRSARAVLRQMALGLSVRDVVTEGALRNAMAVYAAVGGSTNFLLHLPAIAHAAGLRAPTLAEWKDVNSRVPRLVDALPNGPHPTVRVFLAGGVPEVMRHLRGLGLLDLTARAATGEPLGATLEWWERSERRHRLRERLREMDGVDPDDVILPPEAARARGLTSTVSFVGGNLAPQGAIVKSTAIDPSVIGADGVYRHTGPAHVFTSERAAIAAIKGARIASGEVLVLAGLGPRGAGMEEVYQVTAALRYLDLARTVALITDARFSGVSTGPCIGHVAPEALAGGPIGRLRDGDLVRIEIDTRRLEGSIDFVRRAEDGTLVPDDATLAARTPHPDLAPDPELPTDTRLWAALQDASGSPWAGAVYDADRIVRLLEAGRRALGEDAPDPER